MSATKRVVRQNLSALASGAPDLDRRLWQLWVRQADSVVEAMDCDTAWQEGATLLADAAASVQAAKVGTVARKAKAMTGPAAARDRALARKAFRVAARLDYRASGA